MNIIIYFVIGNFGGTFSSVNMMKGYMLICWNAEGVHAHLSKCWRGTWSEKGWEPLVYTKEILSQQRIKH